VVKLPLYVAYLLEELDPRGGGRIDRKDKVEVKGEFIPGVGGHNFNAACKIGFVAPIFINTATTRSSFVVLFLCTRWHSIGKC
jgi:hypothetical protein